MLRVSVPVSYRPERHYIVDTLLPRLIGSEYRVDTSPTTATVTISRDGDARVVELLDHFFATPQEDWLQPGTLPTLPLRRWRLPRELVDSSAVPSELPILFGRIDANGGYLRTDAGRTFLSVDIFGSAFFLLSRYDEIVDPIRDDHGRHSGDASFGDRAGILDLPLVDHYTELLWSILRRTWPDLQRKPVASRGLRLSCDVDHPLATLGRSGWSTLRSTAADLIVRKDAALAIRRIQAVASSRRGDFESDPNNTFSFIMDRAEESNVTVTFYFQAGLSRGERDARYSLDNPWIQKLIDSIAARGHEIGLHPSYGASFDQARIAAEAEALRQALDTAGLPIDSLGARQHYLRFTPPTTWIHYEEAQLDHDASLGYADRTGFRAGTSFDFQPYDLIGRRKVNVVERPLHVMDVTVLGYETGDVTKLVSTASRYANSVAPMGGRLNLLWHNDNLITSQQRDAFRISVSDLADRLG